MDFIAVKEIPFGYFVYRADAIGRISYFLIQVPSMRISLKSEWIDGAMSMRLYLSGYVPISHVSPPSQVPVTFFLDRHFPANPPACRVIPPKDSQIVKNHPNVDVYGVVYSNYISQWHSGYSLHVLYKNLGELFAASPPLMPVHTVDSAPKQPIETVPTTDHMKKLLRERVENACLELTTKMIDASRPLLDKKSRLLKRREEISSTIEHTTAINESLSMELARMANQEQVIENFESKLDHKKDEFESLESYGTPLDKMLIDSLAQERAVSDAIFLLRRKTELKDYKLMEGAVKEFEKLFKKQFVARKAVSSLYSLQKKTFASGSVPAIE